jgi:hypothetical protein
MPLTKPDAKRHLEKARSNFVLYSRLKSDATHLDWAVTVLFYTALHLVQAHIVESAATGFDIPRDHPERDSSVARLLPELYTHYRFLSSRSQWARYHVDKPDPTPEQLYEYEANYFKPIETALLSMGISL